MGRCGCRCHNVARGSEYAERHEGHLMAALACARKAAAWLFQFGSVDDRSVTDAAMASGCFCLPNHCAALLTEPPPRVIAGPREQADGWVDPPIGGSE